MNIIQHPNDVKCENCGNILRISTNGIKYQVEECSCMSTKTWQEEVLEVAEYLGCDGDELLSEMTKLRKHDEDELIKMSEELIQTDRYSGSPRAINNLQQLIKDYYAK